MAAIVRIVVETAIKCKWKKLIEAWVEEGRSFLNQTDYVSNIF